MTYVHTHTHTHTKRKESVEKRQEKKSMMKILSKAMFTKSILIRFIEKKKLSKSPN